MWTAETRRTYDRKAVRYPSDVTDAEWDLARPFVDVAQRGSGQRRVDLREVLNAVFYVLGVAQRVSPTLDTKPMRARA